MKSAQLIASIGTDDLERFEQLQAAFLRETGARCGVLVDRTGRLLTSAGDTGGFDQVTFATLAAADFAASDQLATLLGEREFSSLYHHGERHSMFLADIAGWAILAALFDRKTTLGMVRIKTRNLVPRFSAVFDDIAERGPSGSVVHMDVDWAADAEDEIDRLFAE
jgi:predicted regulator of Ras-like GTPase activity (Roadblock/LC7/MglB family)